jgi:hypothetical protein
MRGRGGNIHQFNFSVYGCSKITFSMKRSPYCEASSSAGVQEIAGILRHSKDLLQRVPGLSPS